MYCKKCGNEISDGAKFCKFCGAVQETQAAGSFQKPQNVDPVESGAASNGLAAEKVSELRRNGSRSKILSQMRL